MVTILVAVFGCYSSCKGFEVEWPWYLEFQVLNIGVGYLFIKTRELLAAFLLTGRITIDFVIAIYNLHLVPLILGFKSVLSQFKSHLKLKSII